MDKRSRFTTQGQGQILGFKKTGQGIRKIEREIGRSYSAVLNFLKKSNDVW